jgi:hypothetical protein
VHDYLHRPIELEATNLYDFVKYYEKKKGGTRLDGYHFTQQHRQHQTHTIRKRALYAVPDLIGPRIPNRESIEAAAIVAQPTNEQMIAATNYYTITMLLFHSFRAIDTLAPVDNNNNNNNNNNNRRQHEHDIDIDIDDELPPPTPINETERQYRRWRSAFERWSKPAAVGELLDNAQLFYDSQRDASIARAARAAADDAARRARDVDGAAFGADGADEHDDAADQELLDQLAQQQRRQLLALDDHTASIDRYVNINVNHNQANAIDTTNLHIDVLQDAISAAVQHKNAPNVNNSSNNSNNNNSNTNHFDISPRQPTVQLIGEALNAIEPQFADDPDQQRRLLTVVRPTIADVSRAFTLLPRQHAAFQLVASLLLVKLRQPLTNEQPQPPMRSLVAGAGGCGKTRVIEALRHFAQQWNVPHLLVVSAYTGNAAVLLRGRTVHSAIGLQCKRTSINEKVASATTTALIQQAAVLIIDEVSMIGLTLLNKIDVRLRALRQRDEPFGGMSVVFSGDLLQLPPIADVPVWNTESTTKECVTGRELWRLVDHVVFLTVNMRSGGDQRYADMLERIRYGEWRQADIDMINTRLLNDRLQLQADYASAIVHINAARITINK